MQPVQRPKYDLNSAAEPSRSRVHRAVVATVEVLAIAAVQVGILWVVGGFGGMLLGLFGLAGALFALQHVTRRSNVARVFAPFAMIGFSAGAMTVLTLRYGERADGIAVTEAPLHAEAVWVTFTDAHVDATHVYSKYLASSVDSRGRRTEEGYLRLAPLVAADWTPDRPVTAWAFCKAHDPATSCFPEWADWRDVRPAGASELRAAACAELDLACDPAAPVYVRVVEPLEDALVMPLVFTVVGFVFGWLVYLPIAGVFRKLPPAPVGTDASGDAAAPGAG